MNRLGYQDYFAQGGDASTEICTELRHVVAETLIAIHVNGPMIFSFGKSR